MSKGTGIYGSKESKCILLFGNFTLLSVLRSKACIKACSKASKGTAIYVCYTVGY